MYKIIICHSGHEALEKIIKKYNIKEMHIPYYLCDVVRHTLVKEGCKPKFYHIDDNFYPNKFFPDEDFILYPNYWGICSKNVKKLVSIYPKIIVDNAHAYFDEPKGFACFNAGHKFGYKNSYLWINDGSIKSDNKIIIEGENDILPRKHKFLELHEKYKKTNLLNINTDSIPFIYPFLAETIEEADNLVKILKEEGKTIYRYWNTLPENFPEYKFYSRLVPIPILP